MSANSSAFLRIAPAILVLACTPDGSNTQPTPTKAPAPTPAKAVTPAPTPTPTPTPQTTPPPPSTPPKTTFKKGQLGKPKSPEEVLEFNIAQGDPMASIDMPTALAGDETLADTSKGKLWATFDTTKGSFRCELYEDKAPGTVANFVGLARGVRPFLDKKTDTWITAPFYNGVLFHRVIPGFMVQTGDPIGNGTGGPGYLIADEFDKSLRHVGPGILSMANRGPHTGSSQFFITVAPTPHLDNKHAIFGKCDPKIAIEISKVNTRADRPLDDIKINTITFERAAK